MRILLDIDGVMVTTPSWKPVKYLDDNFAAFDAAAVKFLNKIIQKTNASIILTTSHKSTFNNIEWKAIFEKRGIKTNSIECLEKNYENLNRKEEILRWFKNRTDNDNYVIIDDDKSLNGLSTDIKKNFIMTDKHIGINEEVATDAIEILNFQENLLAA